MKVKDLPQYLILFGAVLTLAFTAACTVDYTENAVEKARAYALENARDLTEYQRNHIRYVYPAIRSREIFGHIPMKLTEYGYMARNRDFTPRKSKRLNYMDLSFAWENIPGLDHSVIVLGNGEQSGNFWEPLRVIYKKNAPIDGDYESARELAAAFAVNCMLELTVPELNRVRFSEAKVAVTTFDLSYAKPEEKTFVPKKRSGGLEKYLASLKMEKAQKEVAAAAAKEEEVQFSLVWQADRPGYLIVLSGVSNGSTLAGWKILSAGVMPVASFEKFLSEKLYLSPVDKARGVLVPDRDSTVRVYRKNAVGNGKEKK